MKGKTKLLLLVVVVFVGLCASVSWAGEMDILVNKLVEKGILTEQEGFILKADAKEQAVKENAEKQKVSADSWAQRIKIKGDARFRTQVEWGKGLAPAHQRIRNRVRARLGIEGQVNEQIAAGIYAVTGGSDPRSTNQTLDDGWSTKDLRLDAYYIKWTPQLPETLASDSAVWVGKFKNPLQKTSLLWDGDICPGGVAAQYVSPGFELGNLSTKAYGNFGFLWLDELSRFQNDPLLFVIQAGLKMDINPEWGSTLNMGVAYYDASHVKQNDNSPNFVGAAGTNSYVNGMYETDFNMVDLLIKYDSKQTFQWDTGHGLYADFVLNAAEDATKNFAWMVGGYLGKKSPKDRGDWKIYGEYRAIQRDALPDFMPDSDFYGFMSNGAPRAGGTNGHGPVFGIDYAVLKNTVLSAKYYYCRPLDLANAGAFDEPYQLLQMDVSTKF